MSEVHVFEASGLGTGPFTLVRHDRDGGKCQHCGTQIQYRFWYRDSAGSEFFVGSTCVAKGDPSFTTVREAVVAYRMTRAQERRDLLRAEEFRRRSEQQVRWQDAEWGPLIERPAAGSFVRHPVFGVGEVLEVFATADSQPAAKVLFGEIPRDLLLRNAKLELGVLPA